MYVSSPNAPSTMPVAASTASTPFTLSESGSHVLKAETVAGGWKRGGGRGCDASLGLATCVRACSWLRFRARVFSSLHCNSIS